MILRRIAAVAVLVVAITAAGLGVALIFLAFIFFTSTDPLGIAPLLGIVSAACGAVMMLSTAPAVWLSVSLFRRPA